MASTDRRLSQLAKRVRASDCLPRGSRILVACSGGPDSLGLLLVCAELAAVDALELAVAHVDHGLRGAAGTTEAGHVSGLAADLGVPFVQRKVDVRSLRGRRKRGLEEAARTARRTALTEMADELDMELIALAHTLDDQAETLLLRLLRGAGSAGLGAMVSRSARFVRPLLDTPRAELRQTLLTAHVTWASDPSNFGGTATRSLLRPFLERASEVFNEQLVPGLARTAALLREDSDFLDGLADDVLARWGGPARGTQTEATMRTLPLGTVDDGLASLALPLARRCVRRTLEALHPRRVPPTADAVARVLALLGQDEGAEAHVSGTLVLRRGTELVFKGVE